MNKARTFIRNVAICDLDFDPVEVENVLDYAEQLIKTTLTVNLKKKRKRKVKLEKKARAVSPIFGDFVRTVNEIDDSILSFADSFLTTKSEAYEPDPLETDEGEEVSAPTIQANFDIGELVISYKDTEKEKIGIVFSNPIVIDTSESGSKILYLLLHVEGNSILHSHTYESNISEIDSAIIFDDPFVMEFAGYIESIGFDDSLDKWQQVKRFAESKGKIFD